MFNKVKTYNSNYLKLTQEIYRYPINNLLIIEQFQRIYPLFNKYNPSLKMKQDLYLILQQLYIV